MRGLELRFSSKDRKFLGNPGLNPWHHQESKKKKNVRESLGGKHDFSTLANIIFCKEKKRSKKGILVTHRVKLQIIQGKNKNQKATSEEDTQCLKIKATRLTADISNSSNASKKAVNHAFKFLEEKNCVSRVTQEMSHTVS